MICICTSEEPSPVRPDRVGANLSVCLSVSPPLPAAAPLRGPPGSARFQASHCSAAVVFPHSYEALRHAARRRVVYFPMAVILACLIRHGSAGPVASSSDGSPLGLGKPKHGSSRTAGASRRTRPCPPHHANFWAEMGPPSCPSLRLGPERAADPFPFLFLMRLVDAAAGPWPCPPTPLITRTAEIGEGSATRRGSIAGFQP